MFQLTPDNAKKATKAALVLHNVLRDRNPGVQPGELDEEQEGGVIVPGAWRDAGVLREMEEVGRGPRASANGKRLRTYLKHYYNSNVGRVPWQDAALANALN